MVTREEFAAFALALPDATPGSHFGQPDFRVRGKIFCGLDRTAQRASLKMRREVQALLLDSRPRTFVAAAGAWGESGWTYVELAQVQKDELRELVTDAWRLIAPARLAARLEEGAGGASTFVISVGIETNPNRRKRARKARKAQKSTQAKKSPRNGKHPSRHARKAAKAAKSEKK
jgi:hypothetical protein